jgi:hypothetical protein
MALIDIGSPAIDRPNDYNPAWTTVGKDNPANDTGTITSVEIWAYTTMQVQVATFYVVSGNYLSTRDEHNIGNVPGGSKQTFSGLDIDVQTGDYLGLYYSGGRLENSDSGGSGLWWNSGDRIPCTNVLFSANTAPMISLYGTGATTPTFPIAKFGGVAITKWNTKEIVKWNTIE